MKAVIIILLGMMTQLSIGQDQFYSFEDAKTEATETDKKILMVFSGSDWCKPCIQLKKTILDTPQFEKVKEDAIVMHLDFPYKRKNKLSKEQTKHNESLAEIYNKSGQFPMVILVDNQGKVISDISYEKGQQPSEFIQLITKHL